MKSGRRILLGVFAVAALAVLGFIAWAGTPLGPAPRALAALKSDSLVTVSSGDYIAFSPAGQQMSTVGFIFYPGGRVEARSYAAPLREIAARGYLTVLVPVRLNLAFFDINAAEPVLKAYPFIEHWVIGGHSLGGVAAALFAKDHPEIDGLVFWASYPPDDALKDSGLPVLSIYGTRDGAGVEKFNQSRALLPGDARFVAIEGGNHAQFGDYGPQPGDNEASIPTAEQQSQVAESVAAFLASLAR